MGKSKPAAKAPSEAEQADIASSIDMLLLGQLGLSPEQQALVKNKMSAMLPPAAPAAGASSSAAPALAPSAVAKQQGAVAPPVAAVPPQQPPAAPPKAAPFAQVAVPQALPDSGIQHQQALAPSPCAVAEQQQQQQQEQRAVAPCVALSPQQPPAAPCATAQPQQQQNFAPAAAPPCALPEQFALPQTLPSGEPQQPPALVPSAVAPQQQPVAADPRAVVPQPQQQFALPQTLPASGEALPPAPTLPCAVAPQQQPDVAAAAPCAVVPQQFAALPQTLPSREALPPAPAVVPQQQLDGPLAAPCAVVPQQFALPQTLPSGEALPPALVPCAVAPQQQAAPCAVVPQQQFGPPQTLPSGGPQQPPAAPCAVAQQQQQQPPQFALPAEILQNSGPPSSVAPCAVTQQQQQQQQQPSGPPAAAPSAVVPQQQFAPPQTLPSGQLQQPPAAPCAGAQQQQPPQQQSLANNGLPPAPCAVPPQFALPAETLQNSGPLTVAPCAVAQQQQQQQQQQPSGPPSELKRLAAMHVAPTRLDSLQSITTLASDEDAQVSVKDLITELETQIEAPSPKGGKNLPDLLPPDTSAALLAKSSGPVTAKAKVAARAPNKTRTPAKQQDEFALPELSPDEKKMYGNFWARYKSTSSLSLGSVDEEREAAAVPSPVKVEPSPSSVASTPAPEPAAVAKGPPTLPAEMPLPSVPTKAAEQPPQPAITTSAVPMLTNDALATLVATVLSQAMPGGGHAIDAAGIAAIQQSLASVVAAAKAQPQQPPQQQGAAAAASVDGSPTKVVDAAQMSKPAADVQPALPSTPSPAASPATPTVSSNPPPTAGDNPPSPCTTLAIAKPQGPVMPVINSGTHKAEYKSFQRFCENSPGAEELKKVWVQGGPQRLAMFQKFVMTGCNPQALECALRFRRIREEEDKDEGEYYPWKDIVAFHDGNTEKALQFVARRRTEPSGTSTDRNDATIETFLYYGRQKKTYTNKTIDDIAISLGCSPAYAAQVASQLDSMSGAVPVQGQVGTNQQALLNPPPPPADNKKPGGKKKHQVDAEGSATAGKGGDNNTEVPNKKARPPRPEGSDLETVISTEDVPLFVKSWIAAANAAQGQAVVLCAELEVLESQGELIQKVRDCSQGIGDVRKKLQLMGPAPIAADVQAALLEGVVFVEGFKKHTRVANGLIAAEKRPAKSAKKAKPAAKAEAQA